jgi:hypothetical protein
MAGERVIVGFRIHKIRQRLWKVPPVNEVEAKGRCAYVSGQFNLRSCRAHGLIAKVPPTAAHRVTPYVNHPACERVSSISRRRPATEVTALLGRGPAEARLIKQHRAERTQHSYMLLSSGDAKRLNNI